jgi:pectate lyase
MGPPKGLALAAVLAAVAATDVTASADQERDLGREVLATNDGWASEGPGTTGGSAAVDAQVYTVTNRAELIAALNNGVVPAPPNDVSSSNPSNEPKIIYVKGTIDGNVDAANNPPACENYFSPDPTTGEMFSYEAFEAAFDPATWGRPGSNTTIVGLGDDAMIRSVWLDIRGSAANPRTNIIIRNITFGPSCDAP